MAKNTKKTSKAVASTAAKTLRDPDASKLRKSLAGSALAQKAPGKETGKAMEAKASKALSSARSSEVTKDLAGSLVSQSRKSR